jgi:hypothetical protein
VLDLVLDDPSPEAVAGFWRRLLAEPVAERLLLVNEYAGVRWYNREAYRELVASLLHTAALSSVDDAALRALAQQFAAAERRSEYRLDALMAVASVQEDEPGSQEGADAQPQDLGDERA